uniref:F-box domain-containing protein n=1 Tax=Ditylenchus dipsaci TaxID=166011 RepID=A0A915E8X9_9BILA
MIKRKSVTQLKVYDKNIKKRRLEKPEKQNKHAVSATLNHERDATSTSTSFDSLPNEILLAIFRKLPIASRLAVEMVSSRWKQLILDQGWNKFYYFDDDFFMEAKKDVIFRKSKHGKNFLQNHVLPHDKEKWRISNEELQTLFRRTAPNLRCINLWGIEVDSSICKLFSQRPYLETNLGRTSKVFQFPNLKSLYLPGIHLNSENLEILARAFPRLELILLSMLGEDSANGLTVLLKKLCHLRDFIIEGCFDCFFDYQFQCLPGSLRRIQVDDVISLPQLISKAIDQCPQLECFIHQYGASELGFWNLKEFLALNV